jgi:hypothetical protein
MASGLYDTGRAAFLAGDVDWAADNIKAVGVDTSDYTVNLATDDFLDDVPAPSRVDTSANLSGKTVTAGVADCDDITLTAVTGDTISALVIYKDTGAEGTSQLIAYIEAGPVTPNGTDIVFNVSDGADKLFKL